MQKVRDFKTSLVNEVTTLIKKAKELNEDLFPINLEEIDRNFEMIHSQDEIVTINESDVTYSNQHDMEDFESEFENLAIEDIAEIIDILETVIEEEETEQEKTQKRISN